MKIKPTILISALVLLSIILSCTGIGSLQVTDYLGDPLDHAIKGEALTILVSSDGLPLASADVYCKINEETPVHIMTDNNGCAVFTPSSLGILKITARKDDMVGEIELSILQKEFILQLQAPSNVNRSEIVSINITADEELVAGADVYWRLNQDVPVHSISNDTGNAVFMPLMNGTLTVFVNMDGFESISTNISVSGP